MSPWSRLFLHLIMIIISKHFLPCLPHILICLLRRFPLPLMSPPHSFTYRYLAPFIYPIHRFFRITSLRRSRNTFLPQTLQDRSSFCGLWILCARTTGHSCVPNVKVSHQFLSNELRN